MLELFVYSIKIEGNDLAALSPLPPDVVQRHGLPSAAVLGDVDPRRPEMTVDGFTPNDDFLKLLHEIVKQFGPELDSVQRQLEHVKNGPVYVVDRRSIADGAKPPFEDVIGWFGVRDGELLVESYSASPNYQLLSNGGPPQLEAPLEERLLAAVYRLVEAG